MVYDDVTSPDVHVYISLPWLILDVLGDDTFLFARYEFMRRCSATGTLLLLCSTSYYFIIIALTRWLTNYREEYKVFGSAPYCGRCRWHRPSSSKTIRQRNQIKSLHHNGSPLEQTRRCSNIPGGLRQPPAQLAQELKSIPVDWAVGPYHNPDLLL